MTIDLDGIVRLAEFEPIARSRMDPGAYDYIAGGSWDEITLAENEAAWLRRRFRPRMLVDVYRADPSTTILGAPSSLPLAIAPTAVHILAHPEAEIATVRAAAAAGIPFTASTSASRTLEEIAAAAPDAVRFFQLYLQRDRGLSRSLVERADAAGYRAIVLTVDGPASGYRERNLRSGFRVPPLANFSATDPTRARAAAAEPVGARLEDLASAEPTWADLAEVRSWSTLPLAIKGILTGEDARLAVEHGVDAIVVSNHGARQLDRTPAPIDVLAEVAAAVDGRAEVWVDGGVRRGLDMAIALALGARAVLVGRPILWALAAGGQAGVERALAILHTEFGLALRLLGAPTPADIRREHLT